MEKENHCELVPLCGIGKREDCIYYESSGGYWCKHEIFRGGHTRCGNPLAIKNALERLFKRDSK